MFKTKKEVVCTFLLFAQTLTRESKGHGDLNTPFSGGSSVLVNSALHSCEMLEKSTKKLPTYTLQSAVKVKSCRGRGGGGVLLQRRKGEGESIKSARILRAGYSSVRITSFWQMADKKHMNPKSTFFDLGSKIKSLSEQKQSGGAGRI